MTTITPDKHLYHFAEFCAGVQKAGGATPHLPMVAETAYDLPLEEQLWRGGCYVFAYNYATAEMLWRTWRPGDWDTPELVQWIRDNWKGLPLRRERKAVRSPEKLAACMESYVDWMYKIEDKEWFTSTSMDPVVRYEAAWDDVIPGVKYVGRYIAIRYLEFLRRVTGVELMMPDIRARDAKFPRQSLALMFPDFSDALLGGNSPEELEAVDFVATACKDQLDQLYGVDVDYYTIQSLSCEYKQSVIGKKQYPGKSLDSELVYWRRVYKHFSDMSDGTEMFEARERAFPAYALGEKSGWDGARDELTRVLVDHGYTWSDAIYNYSETEDFANPVRYTQEVLIMDTSKPVKAITQPKLTAIVPGVYQRGKMQHFSYDALAAMVSSKDITCVVGLAGKLDPTLRQMDDNDLIDYIYHPIADGILREATQEFLLVLAQELARRVRRGEGVISHCNAGRNRSGLLNALIVRELQECSGAEALHIVRTSRPRAVDNEYFEKFLYRLPPVELPRALVQLGGTNGSGKSTPLRDLYNASTDVEFIYGEDGRIDASWLRDFGCVVLGHYKNHNGGCDGVTGSGGLARVNQIIDTVLSDPRFYDTPVYFEGLLLASHVNMKRISIVAAKHDIHYIVVHCDPPLKTCLERIYERNGGKPINEDSVNGRHASMRRYMPKFKAEKIAYYIRWCTDNYPQEAMLATFLRIMRNTTVGIPYDHYCACDSE